MDDFLLFTRTVLEQPTHDVEGRQEAEDGPWRMPNGELVPLEVGRGGHHHSSLASLSMRRGGRSTHSLAFSRVEGRVGRSVGRSGAGLAGELTPLSLWWWCEQADEGALAYLYQQKYSLPMAKLRVISDLGMKRGR